MIIHKFHDLAGERKNQLLTVVNKNGDPLGVSTREECHNGAGKPHLAFMAFVIDRENKIILTKRSKSKSLWTGFWDASVVSHVLSGETPETAARRRGREELGIKVNFKNLGAFYYHARFGNMSENEYCHCLIGIFNGEIHPNPVEIENIRKVSLAELKDEISAGPGLFTPWLKLALTEISLNI